MSGETRPTPPSERLVSLDALRGFALLGILVVNSWVFAMPEATLANPTVYGDFTGVNYWAWFVGHVFAQQKFITIFTLLFGAGIILFLEGDKGGYSPAMLYVRRMGLLVVFGLAHAYLLWYGDILVAYGLCAFAVVLLRPLPAWALTVTGIALVAVPSLVEGVAGLVVDPATIASSWQPAPETLQREVAAYQGSWADQLEHRVPTAFQRQTTGLLSYTGLRVSGTMLLGMALYRWGVLTNGRSSRFYGWLVLGGASVGLATILTGVWYIEAANWAPEAALFWRQFNYWGSFALAGAYVGGVMLYSRWRPKGPLTRALAAVGRTAFSNYILQTVLATAIFYGHGLGLFGQVSRVEILGVVVAIWLVQVAASLLWLRYFRYGPLEWLWRVLTYGKRYPLRVDRSER